MRAKLSVRAGSFGTAAKISHIILQDADQGFHWNNSQATIYILLLANFDILHYAVISGCLHMIPLQFLPPPPPTTKTNNNQTTTQDLPSAQSCDGTTANHLKKTKDASTSLHHQARTVLRGLNRKALATMKRSASNLKGIGKDRNAKVEIDPQHAESRCRQL